tara:strand:- start:247 stop:645 length:399 start_codon:yes stop_codon:yes gene_type:complete
MVLDVFCSSLKFKTKKLGNRMNITYREAKRILAKQEEAREVINSYRGMETLGKRLQLKNNKELILKLFEIEEDDSVIEVFTHLKALYEEQWGDAEATAPPEIPGEIAIEEENEQKSKSSAKKESPTEEVIEA